MLDKTNKLHPDDLWGCDYAYHLAWNIYISRIFCLVSAGHLSRATHKDNWQLAAVTRCNHVCCLERRWRCRGRYFHTLSFSQHQHPLRAELGYRHLLASQSWKCSNLVWWEVRLRAMRVPMSSVQCPVSVQCPFKPVHTLYLVMVTRAHAAMDRRWVTCTFCLGSVELWWRGPEWLWCFIFHWVVCIVSMRNRNTYEHEA